MKALLGAFVSFLTGKSVLFQKSLQQAVPDLQRLLSEPVRTLECGDITIGPEGNCLFSILLTLVTVFPLWVVSAFASSLLCPAVKQGPLVWSLFEVPLVMFSFLLIQRLSRGHPCILTKTGVQFQSTRETVFCPWALFNAPGQPTPVIAVRRLPGVLRLLPWQSQRCVSVLLPICPQAVSSVESRQHDMVTAQGTEVRARQFKLKSDHEAELRGFVVSAEVLGGLLLHLGRALAGPASGGVVSGKVTTDNSQLATHYSREKQVSPAATRDKNGWITVSITRVSFPSLCCDCGALTTTTQAFRGEMPFLHQLVKGQVSLWLRIPVCDACQHANQRQSRKAFWKRFLFIFGANGVGGGLLLGTMIGIRSPWRLDPVPPIICAIFVGLASLPFALLRGRRASGKVSPVSLQRFMYKEGTVALRFRRPAYAEHVLAVNSEFMPIEVPTVRRWIRRG